MVNRHKLHKFVDKARVRAAIAAAERETSAPIVVSIAPYFWGNVRKTAERAFRKHGLDRAPERNGVLIFVVPSRRQFVVLGDVGAHEALGQAAWDAVVATVAGHFRDGDPTRGLELGIEQLGQRLSEHFARKSTDTG
jgi:uncharacterized membrane protein